MLEEVIELRIDDGEEILVVIVGRYPDLLYLYTLCAKRPAAKPVCMTLNYHLKQ